MSASVPTRSPTPAAFTGERFLPTCSGEIAYEHWHRYAFARQFVRGMRVLDVACGEGYGTALLSAAARSAVGVDIDQATIARARATYGEGARLCFVAASCTGLPLPSAAFDVIVSFETVEHLSAEGQSQMLAEFSRVLAEDGLLIISSPNKRLYSDARAFANPYHVHELYRDDLSSLLSGHFPAQHWYHQGMSCWSGIWPEQAPNDHGRSAATARRVEAWVGDAGRVAPCGAREGMYFVVVAARAAAALPAEGGGVSLFTDAEDSELKRAEANAREVLRLDALLREQDGAIARQTGHIGHLEALVAERERLVVARDAAVQKHAAHVLHLERLVLERDAALAGQAAHVRHLEALVIDRDRQLGEAQVARLEQDAELSRRAETLAAQQTALARLQSFGGWIGWPWRRLRQWLVS